MGEIRASDDGVESALVISEAGAAPDAELELQDAATKSKPNRPAMRFDLL
jgi:hypothetical protein